jgi:glycosyltransferase involved in cell wall biosynthesis
MSDHPLVSVIIPAYNEEDAIDAAILSLANQTYNQLQLIVVDDGSDDDTSQTAREALRSTSVSRYSILRNDTNMGQSFARNRGFMHSDGDYTIFHDADDLSTPRRLEKQVEHLESNPSVGVVGGAYFYINPNRGLQTVRRRPTEDREIREGLVRECMINLGTAMFRRSALLGTGLFESQNVEGYELIISVAQKWKLANLPDPVYLYNINEGSRSRKNELRKKAVIAYRSYQASKRLNLSFRYLPLQLGWIPYIYAPTPIKNMVQTFLSPTESRDLDDSEKEMIERLQQY